MAKEEIKAQIDIVEKSNQEMEFLHSYAANVNRHLITLDSKWIDNIDKYYVLSKIADCVNTASDIYYDYKTFSVNALRWLHNIDSLEKLMDCIYMPAENRIKAMEPNQIRTLKEIKVSWESIEHCATNIDSVGKWLQDIHISTTNLNKKIDKLIVNKFEKQHSLSSISKRIDNLEIMHTDLVNTLYSVAYAYRDTEIALKNAGIGLVNKGNSSGKVSSEIQKNIANEKQKMKYPMPQIKIYMNVNDADVYLKQNLVKSDCNVTSQAMLLRRRAYIEQDPNWSTVNQTAIRPQITLPDARKSPKHRYTYTNGYNSYDVQVYSGNDFPASQRKQILIEQLKIHKEGVVIWGPTVLGPNWPHAILITDYDTETDTFYCAEPADNYSLGRIPLSQSSYKGDITKATQYYVVNSVTKTS